MKRAVLVALACLLAPREGASRPELRHSLYFIGGSGLRQGPGGTWAAEPDLGFGYQSPLPLGIELGMLGQGRVSEFFGTSKPSLSDAQLSSTYAMADLRLPFDGLWDLPAFHTVGLKVGASILTLPSGLAVGGQVTTFDLTYRLEQMLGHKSSLGLDLGYRWAAFKVPDASGTLQNADYSGPYAGLILDFWIYKPFNSASADLVPE